MTDPDPDPRGSAAFGGDDADLPADDLLVGVPLRSLAGPHALRGLTTLTVAIVLVLWPDRTDRALGVLVGITCLTYVAFSAIDLVRHRQHRTFWSLVTVGALAGLGAALISQPDQSLVASAQAGGLALIAAAAVGLGRDARAHRVTPWAITRSIGLLVGGGLLLRFPTTLLVLATAIIAGTIAAIGFIQVFAPHREPADHHPDPDGPAPDDERHRPAALGARSPASVLRQVDVARTVVGWIRQRGGQAEDRSDLQAKVFFEGPDSPVRYARFLTLMTFAAVIASVGVVVESTAVVIGAMLIAPLMIPLMGTAFATAMGWPRRMARCGFIAATGAVLAVTTGALVGAVLPRTIDVTTNTEVLSRVSPTALDLVIAIAAGAAGAYAMARSDVSDSLPGVAVAIALVPPLAVVGLCWEQQAWDAGNGALLLFLTNAVAILVAGGLTFVLVGAAPLQPVSASQERVSTAVVALLTVATIIVVLLALNGSDLTRSDLARANIDEVLADWSDEHQAFEVRDTRSKPDGTIVVHLAGPGRPPQLGQLLSDLHDASDGSTPVEVAWVDQQRVTVLDD